MTYWGRSNEMSQRLTSKCFEPNLLSDLFESWLFLKCNVKILHHRHRGIISSENQSSQFLNAT